MTDSSGPLAGLKVVEFAGIGPAPFAAMLMADLGADILRIDRKGEGDWPEIPIVSRGRSSLILDLKDPGDLEKCKSAVNLADVLVEGFRPGVMERLGLGPEALLASNPGLVYGRVTGWGQAGPLSRTAGHDINYLAISGALSLLGEPGRSPAPPLNLLGDYAGGSLYLAIGILAALQARVLTGRGQVVDAAIVDGATSLLAPLLGMAEAGVVDLDRRYNMLGGYQAPHYRCYQCADGQYVAVGALEPKFRAELCRVIGLSPDALQHADDPGEAVELTALLAGIFATKDRDEWAEIFGASDACVSPVLSLAEAARHSHQVARGAYLQAGAQQQPAAAPRLSQSAAAPRPKTPDADTLLAKWAAR